MTRPLRIEYPGAYYHITSRGNERKNIFLHKVDRNKFLSYLRSSSLRYGAIIHAFCLMGNHYHLLVETPRGNLSQIMRHINGAYTIYFNVKHKRRGHLFQGRYKAIIIDVDSYAGELSRYIHLNPVKAGIAKMPENYNWSSYSCYIGRKKKPDWLTTDFILHYYGNDNKQAIRNYQKFVAARINTEYDSPLKETIASTILGNEDFTEFIKDNFLGHKKKDRDLPAINQLRDAPDIRETHNKVRDAVGNDNSSYKKITLYLLHKNSGLSLKEIGEHFGIGESAVSVSSKRFETTLKKNKKLRKQIELLKDQINLSNV